MNRVKALREAQGLSIRTLARRAYVSHEYVRGLELHGLRPGSDRELAMQVAEALGRPLAYVFPEADELPQFRPPADLAPHERATHEPIPMGAWV